MFGDVGVMPALFLFLVVRCGAGIHFWLKFCISISHLVGHAIVRLIFKEKVRVGLLSRRIPTFRDEYGRSFGVGEALVPGKLLIYTVATCSQKSSTSGTITVARHQRRQ